MNAQPRKRAPARFVLDLGERRPVVVTIEDTGIVSFRILAKRTTYYAHLKSLYLTAARLFAEEEKRNQKIDRAIRRG